MMNSMLFATGSPCQRCSNGLGGSSRLGNTSDCSSKSCPTPDTKTAAFNPIVLPERTYVHVSQPTKLTTVPQAELPTYASNHGQDVIGSYTSALRATDQTKSYHAKEQQPEDGNGYECVPGWGCHWDVLSRHGVEKEKKERTTIKM